MLVSSLEAKIQTQNLGSFVQLASASEEADLLLGIAMMIEPDGRMPGDNSEPRWIATAVALFCFIATWHTPDVGAFRAHVRILLCFLKKSPATSTDKRKQQLVELAEKGSVPGVNWQPLARNIVNSEAILPAEFWEIANAALKL